MSAPPSNRHPSRRRFLSIVAAGSASLLAGGFLPTTLRASKAPSLVSWSGIVLGAEASIQLHHTDPEQARALLRQCLAEIQRLESFFSLYDDRSLLSRLNRQGELIDPPAEFLELLSIATDLGHQTHGVFDVTIHPVVEATRRHFAVGGSSEELDLDKQLSLVDFRRLSVHRDRIKLELPSSAVTLNGIAQGFITDRIALLLRQNGIHHSLIDLGEKRALDSHPSGRPWNLLLADANERRTVELDNMALSSSGGYGTPFDATGRHHHLIDPRTGISVNRHRSVHVLAPDATTADALSTALATCRAEETQALLDCFPRAKAIFI
ncbi:FAD:protein FMN transferase [Pelagicoccus sp. SDUM812003]|uniref:FAD:protein FMN transferase n=1 Tax=Pelagicoccus sp. SDUM812003 TaxID=3041267 RepID=UPI00280CA1A1|nr:FAD:protein FMN transferase [Pelagicoccus sp. SDUM812003]MDQ8205237.1 FAD:protein FMN transferase [Pelagicoccus sp. SDUM812003]